MKVFYLLRHEDVHNNSGEGVVAQGVIFDNGMCAMTWLSDVTTVTIFQQVTEVKKIHGHEGRTEVIIEGKSDKFDECVEEVKIMRAKQKKEEGS
jgi:hypothetical protein